MRILCVGVSSGTVFPVAGSTKLPVTSPPPFRLRLTEALKSSRGRSADRARARSASAEGTCSSIRRSEPLRSKAMASARSRVRTCGAPGALALAAARKTLRDA